MNNALLSILENPTLSSNLAFKPIATKEDVGELVKQFASISKERLAALKALNPKPQCPAQYAKNFPELVSKLSATLDFERHIIRSELQRLEADGGEAYLRRDELVDVWGRIEGARSLLKLLYKGSVEEGTDESKDPARWQALIESERKVAESVVGYVSLKHAKLWTEESLAFLKY